MPQTARIRFAWMDSYCYCNVYIDQYNNTILQAYIKQLESDMAKLNAQLNEAKDNLHKLEVSISL